MGKQVSLFGFLKDLMLVSVAFLAVFLYLHQKVMYYVQAYELSAQNYKYSRLVDEKDALVYTVSKQAAISNLNGWRTRNEFDVVRNTKGSVVYSRLPNKVVIGGGVTQAFLNFIGKDSRIPNAFAIEQ